MKKQIIFRDLSAEQEILQMKFSMTVENQIFNF